MAGIQCAKHAEIKDIRRSKRNNLFLIFFIKNKKGGLIYDLETSRSKRRRRW